MLDSRPFIDSGVPGVLRGSAHPGLAPATASRRAHAARQPGRRRGDRGPAPAGREIPRAATIPAGPMDGKEGPFRPAGLKAPAPRWTTRNTRETARRRASRCAGRAADPPTVRWPCGGEQPGARAHRAAEIAHERAHVVPTCRDQQQLARGGKAVGDEAGLVQVYARGRQLERLPAMRLAVCALAIHALVAGGRRHLIAPPEEGGQRLFQRVR